MELEFYQELIIIAVFSLLIAFFVSKIAVVGACDGGLKKDESVYLDLGLPDSSVVKSERSASKEAESCASRSGTEEVLVSLDRVGEENIRSEDVIYSVNYAQMSGMVGRVKEEMVRSESNDDICSQMSEIMEKSRCCDDAIEEEEKGEVDRLLSFDSTEIDIDSRSDREELEDEGSLLHGEDDWEGIEKSDLEKRFGLASEYGRSSNGAVALARLSSDAHMELYGLSKIAIEGPCHESQPLPLSFSARAKWQAWQRLGNMAPETAMEHYISLLSKYMPEWMDTISGGDAKCERDIDSPVEGISDSAAFDLTVFSEKQFSSKTQRNSSELTSNEIGHTAEGFANTFILNLLSPTRGAWLSIYW